MKTPWIQRQPVVFFLALICCALWGSAFPCIKLGMEQLDITSADTADVILFAGGRFTLAGIFIVIIGSVLRRQILLPRREDLPKIGIVAAFQTVGQYIPYYIGLAHTTSVNTAIVDSLAYFFAILTATLVFRLEQLDAKKVIGCLLGFLGVVIINTDGASLSIQMSLLGEGLILLSAWSYSFSAAFSKVFSQKVDPLMLSGYQFFFGGLVISAVGLLGGARPKVMTGGTLGLFIYLAMISTCAFTIWTILLKHNDVSKVAIYGFTNPIFGVLLSALILGEYQGLTLKYLIALAVICVGIALVNIVEKRKQVCKEVPC